MEHSKLDLSGLNEKMKSVDLVLAIFEIRDNQFDNNKIFTDIFLNDFMLDMIDEINFIYLKDGLEPTNIIKKVGYLNNLNVYLDPNRKTNNITFMTDDKEIYELEIIL